MDKKKDVYIFFLGGGGGYKGEMPYCKNMYPSTNDQTKNYCPFFRPSAYVCLIAPALLTQDGNVLDHWYSLIK